MPNGTYGGVRGRKTKVGRKLLRFPPTRLYLSQNLSPILILVSSCYSSYNRLGLDNEIKANNSLNGA